MTEFIKTNDVHVSVRFAYVIPFAAVVLSLSLLQVEFEKVPYLTAENQKLNPLYVGTGQEYIPIDTSIAEIVKRGDVVTSDGVIEIHNYNRADTRLHFDYQAKENVNVTLPYIYYKGYSAYTEKDGEIKVLPLAPGENHLVMTELSENGTFHLDYTGTLVQKMTLWVSLLSLLFLIGHILYLKRSRKEIL